MKLFLLAHGLVGRTDLPIPKWLFGWAAAVVLVISFAALAVLWPKPELQDERGRRLFRMPRFVEPLVGLLGVAAFVAVVYSGLRSPASSRGLRTSCRRKKCRHRWNTPLDSGAGRRQFPS
jgi:hypothetical protein